jgi:hypothetical protein
MLNPNSHGWPAGGGRGQRGGTGKARGEPKEEGEVEAGRRTRTRQRQWRREAVAWYPIA